MDRVLAFPHAPWYHEDNGFSSRAVMDAAHRPILELVRQVLSADAHEAGAPLRVLDLGCGNGVLAAKVGGLNVRVVPAGVDVGADKIDRARRLLPAFAPEFTTANLFDSAAFGPPRRSNYLTLLMLGRLIEVPSEQAREFLARARRRTRHLLVYAYADYVRAAMPLAAMAARVGLGLVTAHGDPLVSLAV